MEAKPIQDLDSERAVLGAILQDNSALWQVREIIQDDSFSIPQHAKIFVAMIELAQSGHSIDFLTLNDKLEKMGEHDIEPDYIVGLTDFSTSPAMSLSYAQIVAEKQVRRRLSMSALKMQEMVLDPRRETKEVIEEAAKHIFSLACENGIQRHQDIDSILRESFNLIDEYSKTPNGLTGLSYGYTALDQLTCGLQKKDLIIIASRPAMGKTAFGLNVACNVDRTNKQPVAFFSIEMAASQLGLRMLSIIGLVDSSRIRSGRLDDDELQRLCYAGDQLSHTRLEFDDQPALSLHDLRLRARRLKYEKDIGLLIIDYLQLIRGPRSENRQVEISAISQELKAMAKELDIPVIALAQLSRRPETRINKRPLLGDLRESGSIEQDADIVMFLYRPSYYELGGDNVTEVIVAKHRNGPTGTIKLYFHEKYMRFTSVSHETEKLKTSEKFT